MAGVSGALHCGVLSLVWQERSIVSLSLSPAIEKWKDAISDGDITFVFPMVRRRSCSLKEGIFHARLRYLGACTRICFATGVFLPYLAFLVFLGYQCRAFASGRLFLHVARAVLGVKKVWAT